VEKGAPSPILISGYATDNSACSTCSDGVVPMLACRRL